MWQQSGSILQIRIWKKIWKYCWTDWNLFWFLIEFFFSARVCSFLGHALNQSRGNCKWSPCIQANYANEMLCAFPAPERTDFIETQLITQFIVCTSFSRCRLNQSDNDDWLELNWLLVGSTFHSIVLISDLWFSFVFFAGLGIQCTNSRWIFQICQCFTGIMSIEVNLFVNFASVILNWFLLLLFS